MAKRAPKRTIHRTSGAAASNSRPEPARFYLVLFQTGSDEPLATMNRRVLHEIQEKLDKGVHTKPEQTEIDLWYESPGGDANVAYKMVLDLRSRCSRLRVVIPDYAKSAATLLVLGTDVIYMSEAAELGPLDMQIEHPDREGFRISALDVADALNWLAKFAVDYTIGGGGAVLHWTNLPRVDVLREMFAFSATLLEPIVGKLDPLLIHKAANELGVAKQYAKMLLEHRRLREGDEDRQPDIDKIIEDLVSNYPAHDFCITRMVATDLGLPVRPAEKYSKWQTVKALHHNFRCGFFSGDGPSHLIELVSEKELREKQGATPEKAREGRNAKISKQSDPEGSKATTRQTNGRGREAAAI